MRGLAEVLSSLGDIILLAEVWESYVNVRWSEYDFSLPRREKKVSKGHRVWILRLDSS